MPAVPEQEPDHLYKVSAGKLMKTAISVKNVAMSYHRRLSLRHTEPHKVLKDVSFDVHQGETLGIIGRNGAGKSTLLRIIAGILKPDSGDIRRNIKTVSLLSLNVGFDPNLSGRDNAILSALLMGLEQQEAIKNIEKIKEFSELGKAMEEPVKTYSSGMSARLGFSIAVHLKPDVLLIDEVLAVGDAEFREKSHKAIKNKIDSEQTVVLVSHNTSQINELCDKAIWIENGVTQMHGETETVMEQYESVILSK